jgi:hypothetical protein
MQILLTWCCLFFLFSGIGLLIHRAVRIESSQLEDLLLMFWTGYAASITILQVWHLFLPVQFPAFLLLTTLSMGGIIAQRRLFRQQSLLFLLALLPVALWTLHYAQHNPPHYDDGLYHAQDLAWIESYPIIPGLGNLHGRLAFNNAATLVMAAVDAVPLFPHPRYVVNGLLLLVFIAQCGWHGWKMIRERDLSYQRSIYLLHLAPALYFADTTNISSLKNDLPVALLSIIVTAELLRYIQHPPLQTRTRQYTVFMLMLLASAAVAIKLSGAVTGGLLIAALVAYVLIRRREEFIPTGLIIALIGAAVIGVWMLRGVILSGYPLYPLSAVSVPVDWRMDVQTVQAEADGVRSWARTPEGDPDEVLGNWNWLPGWWERNQERSIELTLPLLLAALSLSLTAGYIRISRKWSLLRSRRWLFLLPMFTAVGFWFYNAPDTRFGWHILWLMAAGLITISFSLIFSSAMFRSSLLLITLTLLIVVAIHAITTEDLAGEPGQLFPPAPTQNFYTYHGVKLYVPIYSPQCWDAQAPCTPYPSYYVCYRNHENVRDGFRLEEIETDKAAFSLVEIVQEQDIVPAEHVQQLKRGVLPIDGLLVGRGWHSLETWEGGQHRWVENNAEIYVTNPTADKHQLQLEIEPGPSLQGQAFEVFILNEQNTVIASAEVSDHQTIEFGLSLTEERVQIFRLYIEAKGKPAPDDGRILNFRVLQIGWG